MVKKQRCPFPDPKDPGTICGRVMNKLHGRIKLPGDVKPTRELPFRPMAYFCKYCGGVFTDSEEFSFVPESHRVPASPAPDSS